ncbi:hypothetical protein O2W18_01165 [Modestobacter sp. VKM Ac-2983]|uniref:hypothetical protein n=1 Tax=Modestobacter sp. VKM Ac-2983 TaxID=3004137 RepID=UPI0022ABB801|nr:hypothetical protein [Modestobacter sp. VKM Ac-2983]MCZ2803710.1 hypothetical protein [Modestobacter sp. VKM Ac-2983]
MSALDAARRPRIDAAPVPPRAAPRARTCSCGHQSTAHQHYRKGTDCALCGCAKYRGPFRLFSRG